METGENWRDKKGNQVQHRLTDSHDENHRVADPEVEELCKFAEDATQDEYRLADEPIVAASRRARLQQTTSSSELVALNLDRQHVARLGKAQPVNEEQVESKSPNAIAIAALNQFEVHLRQVPRVDTHHPSYAASEYSRLIEAMIIAFLAKEAFIDRFWQTDVQGMLRHWLPPNICQPFFDGNKAFIEAFRAEMKSRAKQHFTGGGLVYQFTDIELGISQTSPYAMGGRGAFAGSDDPRRESTKGCAQCGRVDVVTTPCMACKRLLCNDHGVHYAGMFACPECLQKSRKDWRARIARKGIS